MNGFNYEKAFSRNIGWVTEEEQKVLKEKRIAIAGLGGVGGSHLVTLVRLGIENFNLSDFDEYECENTNRQIGANVKTYNLKKLDTMVECAKSINPNVKINLFPNGINLDNSENFLENVDCYVDSLDFFVMKERINLFKICNEKNIPSITAAPIGMGTAYLSFLPNKMTFEEYFRMKNCSEEEQYLRFFIGLAPSGIQSKYLVDSSKLDLKNKKGPSTMMGCQLASGVAGVEVLKILLNRGKIIHAPFGLHFDSYLNKLKKTWRPYGNNNVIQKIMIKKLKKKMGIK